MCELPLNKFLRCLRFLAKELLDSLALKLRTDCFKWIDPPFVVFADCK